MKYKYYYAEANYDNKEIENVLDVLKNNRLNLVGGEKSIDFENKVCSIFGKKKSLFVNSCSSANLLALLSLDLENGSEVITPSLTFSTTVAPIIQSNLIPNFIDVEIDSYLIDISRIEENITPKTKVLMIPNLIGNIPNWKKLREIADKNNLFLIEDSADTIGTLIDDKNTGNLSDIVTTSFYASHIITCAGVGGMVCFNNEAHYNKAKMLRAWGRSSALSDDDQNKKDLIDTRFKTKIEEDFYDSKYLFNEIGYNFLTSEISAAFGLEQLNKLNFFIEKRQYFFSKIYDFFKNHSDYFILPQFLQNVKNAWLAFPIQIKESAPFKRIDLQKFYELNSIQTRPIFTGNIMKQPGFKKVKFKEDIKGFNNTNLIMKNGLLIGCHNNLNDKLLVYLFEKTNEFLKLNNCL